MGKGSFDLIRQKYKPKTTNGCSNRNWVYHGKQGNIKKKPKKQPNLLCGAANNTALKKMNRTAAKLSIQHGAAVEKLNRLSSAIKLNLLPHSV